MKDLYLVGAGGHCVSCIDVIEATGLFRLCGLFDRPEKVGDKILGVPVLGTDDDIAQYVNSNSVFLITVGQIKNPEVRIKLFNKLKGLNASFATVISPRAHVSKHATVAEGSIIMHDALVNANAKVGVNCIINTKALVEHDSIVEGHTHIATAAVVNGNCHVKEGSFIGSNSVLKEGAVIEQRSVLGAGAFHR
ncbi:MAG: NeuD/PglB/VioB family sugar acetyltransferase [Bdellovibrio sp.]